MLHSNRCGVLEKGRREPVCSELVFKRRPASDTDPGSDFSIDKNEDPQRLPVGCRLSRLVDRRSMHCGSDDGCRNP